LIQRHATGFRIALMSADALGAVLVFTAVGLFRFGDKIWWSWTSLPISLWLVVAAYASLWVIALWLQHLYILRARWSLRSEVGAIVRAVVVLAVATFSVLFLLKLPEVSRLFLLLLFPAQAIVTLFSRIALRELLGWMRRRGLVSRSMLVVGAGPEAQAFADLVGRHDDLGIQVIGHVAWDGDVAPSVTRPILGTPDDLEGIFHSRVVDEVAIALPVSAWDRVEPITRLCQDEGKIVRISMSARELGLPAGRVEELNGVPILSVLYGPDRVLGLAAKRVLDIVASAVALVVLSPIFVGVAAWTLTSDGPPIFFRQTRMGLHGRPFKVIKFRTMTRDAEARQADLLGLNEIRGHAFKLTHDPRLIRGGGILRRASLDELPQLWNVLRGQMSLVGPRPPLAAEVANYDIWHRRRLSMKPGITGAWQVSGRREADFDRWVELDLDYIDRWSLWLDFTIMLRTIPVVVMPTGR
jgi:exopolysaccharide biosynthesis polyprenyl glycosylphosphotransferase